MGSTRIKVYELAKELAVDPQQLVEVVQRLGIDVKTTMTLLGTEEVRTVREYYKKNKAIAKSVATAKAAAEQAKPSVTEKRVGATVIRRRSVDKKSAGEPTSPTVELVSDKSEQESSADESSFQSEANVSASQFNEAEEAHGVTETEAISPEGFESSSVDESVEVSQDASAEAEVSTESVGAKAAEAPKAPRRFYPSIIKKVATEQHLSEKVGPKVEKKDRPKEAEKPKTDASKTAAKGKPSTPGTTTSVDPGTGLKRVKEVDFSNPTSEAAKEAAKRRTAEGQITTFKRSDYLKRELVHATKKKKAASSRPAMKTQITTPAEHKRVIEMGDSIQVGELAAGLNIKAGALIGKLMGMGVTATINQTVDHDTASLVAHEYGFEIKQKVFREEDYLPPVDVEPEKLKSRPPVVTIMGHVDHGKTSLLDAIRKTNVASGEAGGITQHVGAYTVNVANGKVTFVDTPGHEAFTAMRARGAKVTDIVVLVVSAVDGVMPQTLESVSHAQAANVPIIVAVNKTDLPEGNPDRIKQTLAGHNLSPEEWGGETIYVNVSAKTGKGIDSLLESILLQAEVMELKANYDCPARGTIIESKLDKNKGVLATVLIQHGALKVGATVACGTCVGKIRAMSDSFGKKLIVANPGDPVEVLGFSDVPSVGDVLAVMVDEAQAREVATLRLNLNKAKAEARPKMTLEEMMAGPSTEKELRVILKSDVQGSAEALKEALIKIPSDKAKVRLLHTGTGGVTESDVMLASASNAAILAFNVRPDLKALKLAETNQVEVRTYTIIYDLLEDVKKLMEGLLDKIVKERVIGRAEVREIFSVPKVGVIAGSSVIDGKVQRGCFLRLLRDNRVVYEGKISSLRRFKEDVKEVAQGFECGIGLENFNDLKQGDQFEAFLKEESKGSL